MTSVFFTPASRLTFLPPALVNLVRQQLEDDGLKPGEAETERRLNAARLAAADGGPDPVFFFAIEPELGAEGPNNPAELVNRSDLLGFAFANVCFGLECGGTYLWINELHVAGHARRRGVGKSILEFIDTWARSRDMAYLACLTGSENRGAQTLYRGHGYDISRVNWVEKIL
jgi:GNAT superfamily N-acetyltransferase